METVLRSAVGRFSKAAKVSGLMPVFRWVRYESLQATVRLPMEIKTKSVKCSMVFATALVMLALKSMRYCSSSVAVVTLEALYPFLSEHSVFS